MSRRPQTPRTATSILTLVALSCSHSFRLEHKLGPRLKVRALIDPSASRADAVLTVKRNSFVLSAYQDTVVYPTFEAYLADEKQKQFRPQWV